MMSGHGANQFSLIKKIKIGHLEHLLTPHPLRPITSHFHLTPPTSLKVDVMCITPYIKGMGGEIST